MGRVRRGWLKIYATLFESKLSAFSIVLLSLVFLAGCFVSPVRIIPAREVESIQAESSFFYHGEAGQGRSRLLMYLQTPDRLRLEIFNPFGGLEYILWLNGEQASLYLPGKKVFWEGSSLKLTTEFLGGPITTNELAWLFSGRIEQLSQSPGWKSAGQRPSNFYVGEKDGWKLSIKEFFKGGEIPRTIYFEKPGQVVRLRLLKIKFNPRFSTEVFLPSYAQSAEKLSWEEISELWKK
ncbi:MAG: LolA family protein [Candidatus Saccharicenans sp.]